jgi:hypothetical protein
MNFSLVYALLLAAMIGGAAAAADPAPDADLVIRVVFNQGKTEGNKMCNAEDWATVADALDIAAASGRRRRLRRSTTPSRHLTSCEVICQYFRPGTCYAWSGTGCRNRRLLLNHHSAVVDASEKAAVDRGHPAPDRALANDKKCTDKIKSITKMLKDMKGDIDKDCMNLVKSQVDFSCLYV